MRRILQTLFAIIVLVVPALALANSVEYIVDDQIFSGDFAAAKDVSSDLHFNQNGNDFGGKIFFLDLKTVDNTYIKLNGDEKICNKQIRGFYINPVRGNRIRPLDEDSLSYLRSIDSSYDALTLTGGLFVCGTPSNAIFGDIEHIWSGKIYNLIAGVKYDFNTNASLPFFDEQGNLFFDNTTTEGYIWDYDGGIAEVFGSGLNVSYVCGDGLTEDNELCDDGANNGILHYCNVTCNGLQVCDDDEVEVGGVCDDGAMVPNNLTGNITITGTVVISGAMDTGTLLTGLGQLTIVSEEDPNNTIIIPGTIGFIIASGDLWDGDISAPEITGEATNPELLRDLPPETSTTSYAHDILLTMKAGSDDAQLRPATGVFTITINVGNKYNNQFVNVYRSEDGDHWDENAPDTGCFVTNNICTFTTDHLSFFAPAKIVATPKGGSGNGGGGGGGGGPTTDVKKGTCEQRDCSSSYYDGICGPCVITTGTYIDTHGSIMTLLGDITDSPYSQELNMAYQRAYSVGITSMSTIQRANMDGTLLRKHAAKMISEFAIKILGKKPDTTRSCVFTDIATQSDEMQFYMKISCQLGLMGLNSDGTPNIVFHPDGQVTRAQFGTMLSRLLYGNMYNTNSGLWYQAHLQVLQTAGIMIKISNPLMLELRGYVMLMMMRVNEDTSLKNIVNGGINPILNIQNLDVTFDGFVNNMLSTGANYVVIKGTISGNLVSKIVVSHIDSNGNGIYSNYTLQKFIPGNKSFLFNANAKYASLTLHDINTYTFEFFDKDGKLLLTKSISINQK